jgi:hypothetical protein
MDADQIRKLKPELIRFLGEFDDLQEFLGAYKWDEDRARNRLQQMVLRDRCRAAGIPDEVVYRPKWKIALELLHHARGNGVVFHWLTFDEGYGGKPEFLRELAGRGKRSWPKCPRRLRAGFARRG